MIPRILLTAGFALSISSASLFAQIYIETGDAGQTPGTAQISGLTQPGTVGQSVTILGSFVSFTDADVFSLTLTAPGQVQFSTMNLLTQNTGGPGGLDTILFLFDSSGHPIYANDDATGTAVQSKLSGNSYFTMSLAPGTYLIGISLSGNEPVNTASQLMFATNSDSTAVRGPAAGLNPATFSGFNGATSFNQSGSYQIDITTVAVPEPATTALLVLSVLFFTPFIPRRKLSFLRTR